MNLKTVLCCLLAFFRRLKGPYDDIRPAKYCEIGSQVKVGDKSNEITAIPPLLELLALRGCIVTIDAMVCQREIAEQIVESGADYVLVVKENQGQLNDDLRDLFHGAEEYGFEGVPHDYARTLNKGHGRIETRECWVITDLYCLDYLRTKKQWTGLKAAVKISARRETVEGAAVQSRYYISNLKAPAEKLLEAVRQHWSIENSLHWSLDVTFGEDQCRVRKDHAPQNLPPCARFPTICSRRRRASRPVSKANASTPAGARTTS